MNVGTSGLLIEVFLHEGRYHGEPGWPPSPARLFQALVAAGARTMELDDEVRDALQWLEGQGHPVIGAPLEIRGQELRVYVPNNDLDAKGGDPERVDELRVPKLIHPRLFAREVPFMFVWPDLDPADEDVARRVCKLSRDLYQFGRGVDMAWARGQVLDGASLEDYVSDYAGRIYRPAAGGHSGHPIACPGAGSVESLAQRHRILLARLAPDAEGRGVVFRQAPKPRFVTVSYESPPARALFELRDATRMGAFSPHPFTAVVEVLESIRDGAAARLADALSNRSRDVERALVGRTPDGMPRLAPTRRVRVIPLPSIGHEHVDRSVRRLLVEVPGDCPLRSDDVFWAFSGLALPAGGGVLRPTGDERMLGHYGVGEPFQKWRTVTPAALPEHAARRRIDPRRIGDESKSSAERRREEAKAVRAVAQAVRHAGIRERVERVWVQREPFEAHGQRAEAFAARTRFTKERLWHIEIRFRETVAGPVIIGDGRFLGLGLLAPVRGQSDVLAFRVVHGLRKGVDPLKVTDAFRRAVMARYARLADQNLPGYVSGHSQDGGPLEDRPHLYYVFDPGPATLLIVPPHLRDRRDPYRFEEQTLHVLRRALAGFRDLRAGHAGHLRLRPLETAPDFPVARRWTARTPYVVQRHTKAGSPEEAAERDIMGACHQAGLPQPKVAVQSTRGVSRLGLTAEVTVEFPTPVAGPVLLGRTRHRGGGWFVPAR